METIIRVKRKRCDFVQIYNRVFDNPNLSWRAKGILGYLLTKPDNWQIRFGDILAHGTEGRDTVRAALQELKDAGHAEIVLTPNGKQWIIMEEPCPEKPSMEPEKPCPEKAMMEKTIHGISGHLVTLSLSNTHKNSNTKGVKVDIPLELNTPEFLKAWGDWQTHRSEIKHKLTPSTATKQVLTLLKIGAKRAVAAIENSIEKGYQGIYEPNGNGSHQNGRTNPRNVGVCEGPTDYEDVTQSILRKQDEADERKRAQRAECQVALPLDAD